MKNRGNQQAQALTGEIVEALALAVPPASPRDPAALRDRVLGRARADRARFVTVRTSDGHWRMLAPGVAMKMLHDDGAMQSFLLRLDAGASLPAHDHAVDELCVVLEGSVRLGDIEVSRGDYHLAVAGSRHGRVVSPEGAVLFLRTRSDEHATR